jgi:hypothetical protein
MFVKNFIFYFLNKYINKVLKIQNILSPVRDIKNKFQTENKKYPEIH